MTCIGRLLNNLIEISVYFLVYLFLFLGGEKMGGITIPGMVLIGSLAIIGVIALVKMYNNKK